MNAVWIYLCTGAGLIALGVLALVREPHFFRKVLAFNITGSGIFLLLVAAASRVSDGPPDPVPHAMVLTGIVVSVSATAVGLALAKKYHHLTGHTALPGEEDEE